MPEDSEVLSWPSLAKSLDNLKSSLESWSCQERVRALERQSDAAQAQQDAAAVTSALRKASFEEGGWEQSLSTLMQNVKAQRQELLKVLEILKHKSLKDSDLADKIPKDSQLVPEELPSFVIQFLEQLVEAKPKAKEKEKEKEEKEEKDTEEIQKKSVSKAEEDKGKDKKRSREKTKEKGKERAKEDRKRPKKKSGKERNGSAGSQDSDSYSYTPSPRRKRRRRRRRRRRPSPSSRSDSYTPSRESRRRRGRRKRRRREEKDKLNVTAEIDRFVRVNKLEERCEKILRDLDGPLACKVMGLSGGTHTFELSGDVRDPTAVVLARIRKAQFAQAREMPRRRKGRRSSSSR